MSSDKVFHYHRVLISKVDAWLLLGWKEVTKDRPPSLSEDVVLIEFAGETAPTPEEK